MEFFFLLLCCNGCDGIVSPSPSSLFLWVRVFPNPNNQRKAIIQHESLFDFPLFPNHNSTTKAHSETYPFAHSSVVLLLRDVPF